MDFSPIGNTAFYGTDQIVSNPYMGNMDNMITDAQIHQRSHSPYSNEIAKLQRVKMQAKQKQAAAASASTTTKSNNAFVTAKLKGDSPEPFHINPMRPSYGRPVITITDDMIMLFILVVILAFLYIMTKATQNMYITCQRINDLTNMMIRNRDSQAQAHPTAKQQTSPVVGLMDTATV